MGLLAKRVLAGLSQLSQSEGSEKIILSSKRRALATVSRSSCLLSVSTDGEIRVWVAPTSRDSAPLHSTTHLSHMPHQDTSGGSGSVSSKHLENKEKNPIPPDQEAKRWRGEVLCPAQREGRRGQAPPARLVTLPGIQLLALGGPRVLLFSAREVVKAASVCDPSRSGRRGDVTTENLNLNIGYNNENSNSLGVSHHDNYMNHNVNSLAYIAAITTPSYICAPIHDAQCAQGLVTVSGNHVRNWKIWLF